jgi:hypothetical protein
MLGSVIASSSKDNRECPRSMRNIYSKVLYIIDNFRFVPSTDVPFYMEHGYK